MDQKITEHFNLGEFTRSATATANNIDNSLNPDRARDRKVIENLQNLCIQVLEPLREFMDAPVVISSGYRCPELNNKVGGVWNSQHLTGEAVDLTISDKPISDANDERLAISDKPMNANRSLREAFLFIQNNCWFDQLILETKGNKRWIHVSCLRNCKGNRMDAKTISDKKTISD